MAAEFNRQLADFESRSERLREDKARLLRLKGWDQSSAYPDHCWRWFKVVPNSTAPHGVLVCSNVDEALRLEAGLQPVMTGRRAESLHSGFPSLVFDLDPVVHTQKVTLHETTSKASAYEHRQDRKSVV